jgi:hypothetical protein
MAIKKKVSKEPVKKTKTLADVSLNEKKAEYKKNLTISFKDLFCSIQCIPVAPIELFAVVYQLQAAQAWLNCFVDSLAEKPVDDAAPQENGNAQNKH